MDIEEIKNRRNKLSSLPWKYCFEMVYDGLELKNRWLEGAALSSNYPDYEPEGQSANADYEFIENAANDMSFLLSKLELAMNALGMYADMIVIDSEDRPHDVGMLARETLFEIDRVKYGEERVLVIEQWTKESDGTITQKYLK